MLLRGVKFSAAVLNQSDIEATKGRAAKSGRSHGGVPLRGDSRGRNTFDYASSNHQPQMHNRQQNYGSHNSYSGHSSSYPPLPSGWQPPPPGTGTFARGPPPPLPNAYEPYDQRQEQVSPPLHYGAHSGYGLPPGAYEDRRRGDGSGHYRGGYSGR
jgi:5'-3' exoribonuclease 2